jgi:septum site-determining protein MinD
VIPDDERVIVSTNRGEPLVLGDTPSLAALAVENIARRLEGETVEFLDLDAPPDNIFARLRKLLWTKIV